jgi:cell division protein FtsB
MQYLEERKHLKNIYNKIFRADNILPILFFSILLYAVFTLTLSKNNLKEFIKKQETKAMLEEDINNLKKENENLKKLIEKLKTDPYLIEKLARENLGLAKENDEIFIILEDKKESKKEKSDRWIDKIKNIYKKYYLNN